MKFELKNRITLEVMFSSELEASFETKSLRFQMGAAVKKAVEAKADLRGAYLRGADLSGADLRGAYLSGADLSGADLSGADLRGAYLSGAYLSGADLRGAYLSGAERATDEQAITNLDKVREIILDDAARLYMDHWHNTDEWENRTCAEEAVCGTTHCLAGWLQVCATDPKVREMETQLAGIVQAPVASKMFFRQAPEVLDWLKERKYVAEIEESNRRHAERSKARSPKV